MRVCPIGLSHVGLECKVSRVNLDLTSSLHAAFADLPDPRANNRIHPLINIVLIALLAVIAGADDYTEFEEYGHAKHAFLGRFLKLEEGIPSHDTFARVFALLDPTRWQACCLDWVRHALRGQLEPEDLIALDGKVLRGSGSDAERAVNLVSAWSTRAGLCLAQTQVNGKSNEITALPPLIETLDLLDLSGCTVSVDAVGAQREVARLLTEKRAAYLLALKDNQARLAEDVAWLFRDAFQRGFQGVGHDYFETNERWHGRDEHRCCWVLSEVSFLEPHAWPGLRAVALVESQRTIQGVSSLERRYFLSSLEASAVRTLGAVRGHWGVENSLHWALDVVFNEDAHRARSGHAAANLGVLRRLALNLLHRAPAPKRGMSLKGKRKRAGWDDAFLERVLAQL